MDLAARSIDLLTALGNTANSPNSVIRTAVELGRWLGRERLNENELQFCFQQARSLVLPNETCDSFYQRILVSSPPRSATIFVTVQASGSLGRLIANDLNLRWLTSTISGLFQFHSERFISDAICTFMIQARRPAKEAFLTKRQLCSNTDRVKIQPVLEKIISSIWFYVVNSGTIKSGMNKLLPLPEELENAGVEGRHLESYELGTVLAQLWRCEGELIIDSEHLLKNLTSWLLYHFTGHIRVVVKGQVLYSQSTGDPTDAKRIEIRVRPSSSASSRESTATSNELNIYTLVAGNLQSLFRAPYSHSPDIINSEPRTRSKLYHTSIRYPEMTTGRDSIKALVRTTAVYIVDWILKLPVLKSLDLPPHLVFEVNPKQVNPTSDNTTRLANLLARYPSIFNLGWPEYSISKFVYAEPVAGDDDRSNLFSHNDGEHNAPDNSYMNWVKGLQEPQLKTVLEHYPILRDALREVKKSCHCWSCRNNIAAKQLAIFRGCLQHTALIEIMQLIAHAIADGFGCDDVSAVSNIDLEHLGVLEILGIISEGQVRWNDWFTIVARAYLGCPPPTKTNPEMSHVVDAMPQMKGLSANYTPTVLAVQYGGIAVVAPWIDMSINLCQTKPFAIETVVGRIGIPVEDSEQIKMQNIEGDFAVIEARDAENLEGDKKRLQVGAKRPSEAAIRQDNTAVDIDVILVNSAPSRYQLWLRVSTTAHSRLINPSSAMRNACRLDTKVVCNHHDETPCDNDTSGPVLVRTHGFNEVLSLWGPESASATTSPPETPIVTASPSCDSYKKLNTVLSFADSLPIILSPDTACFPCITERAQRIIKSESGLLTNGFVIAASDNIDGLRRTRAIMAP